MNRILEATDLGTADPFSPSRRWDDPPVLAALAAVVIAALWVGTLLGPRQPGDRSAEAGFARDMSAHHAQGVELAELARSRTVDDEIRTLAADIALTQQGQIGQMSGWLAAWGLSPTRAGDAMEWMGHPTRAPMPGMATEAEIAALAAGPAGQVDTAFLRLMIPHHRGGVLMARAALDRVSRPEVRNLARAVAQAQQAEVTVMETMLIERGASPVTEAVTMPPMSDDAGHDGHSSAALGPTLLRFLPIGLGILAAAWLAVDGARRRRTWAGLARPPATVIPEFRWAAALGLGAAGMIHLALTPAHLAEGWPYGLFFVAAAGAQLAAAAAVIAWPAPSVMSGAVVLSLVLVAVYFAFRLVPAPGAEVAETFDAVGLFTQSLQVATVGACASARGLGWARLRDETVG